MSYQAYLKNIHEKTGKTAQDFRKLAEEKGFTKSGVLTVKATEVTNWLKADFDLGHGHAMAIVALLAGRKDENSK
jgi:hypothetical protein